MKEILRCLVGLFLMLCTAQAATPSHYEYTIIAQSGMDGFTGFETGVSINDAGQVAFIAQTNVIITTGYETIYRADGTSAPAVLSPGFSVSSRSFGPFLQINNRGDVVTRDRFAGSPPKYFVRTWNATSNIIAQSGVAPYHYDSVSIPTLNNAGQVAFVALEQGSLNTSVKMSAGSADVNIATYPSSSFTPRPLLDDNGGILFRDGTGQIVKWNATGTGFELIASTGTFTGLGQSPGVSDDGQIVTFAGNLSVAGAAAVTAAQPNLRSLDPGPGVFASVQVGGSNRVVVRIAGLAGNGVIDPGETFVDSNRNGTFDPGETEIGYFSGFTTDARVGVNSTHALQRAVTVVFMATSTGGTTGIYSARLNFFSDAVNPFNAGSPGGFTVSQPSLVMEVGANIPGLAGTVEALSIYDPVNNRDRGDVAFYARLTGGLQAVIRASPVDVVFLDFDPVHHFTLGPSADALLASHGIPGTWFGNMGDVFTALAPGRADLNPAAIQDHVVIGIQAAFDDVDPVLPGNQRVRANVFGRVGEQPPTDGPFVRVFIGDGPDNAGNPRPLAGISPIDLFNQGTDDSPPFNILGGYFQKTPLIFVDNLFRRSSGFFTTQAGAGSAIVGLDTVGLGQITPTEVENALIKTIAHELGHTYGLMHLDSSLNTQLMNAQPSSPVTDGYPIDEMRVPQTHSNLLQLVDAFVTGRVGTVFHENSAARLAFALGSATPPDQLSRDLPNPNLQGFLQRANLLMGATLPPGSLSVQRAALGLVPLGQEDAMPDWIDLGSGDLSTLLNRPIPARPGDQVFLIATTTGAAPDVFSVAHQFAALIQDIDLSNGLRVMTELRIRGDLFSHGQPQAIACDLYQKTPGGLVPLGSIGSPAASPRLRIEHAAGALTLSWPQTATGFELQSAPDLLPGSWSRVDAAMNSANGQITVTIPVGISPQFFRLYKP